jgi:protoporphyrinogen oxidase
MVSPRGGRVPGVLDGTVVVVGAGVAGLVTAHVLAEAGCDVVVIEKLPVLGGLARSFVYEGFSFDVGPHRFHTANPNISAYLDRILKGESTSFPRLSEVYFRDRYYRWPLRPSNLRQLPLSVGAKAFVDLAVNGLREHDTSSFEGYILAQYGRTLYEQFFKDYSVKFLGIHPRDTHPDWAKVGINRAVIDEKLQMHNLAQLAKTTLLHSKQKAEMDFVYPKGGMHRVWALVAEQLLAQGGRIMLGQGAVLEGSPTHVEAVHAGGETFTPSMVVWTAPLTLAMKQLGHQPADLEYLGLLLYNVLVEGDAPRPYQWCYFGQKDLVFNRISIPRYFSDGTCPPGTHGLCVEVTCEQGGARWRSPESLTDWVVDDLVRTGTIESRRSVRNVYVERVENSYPIYHVNYPAKLEQARKALAQCDNLRLAGRTGLFWYNNMDHSLENAMQLCKRLLREAGRAEAEEGALARGQLAS